jgi:hypothetical protein
MELFRRRPLMPFPVHLSATKKGRWLSPAKEECKYLPNLNNHGRKSGMTETRNEREKEKQQQKD